MKKINWASGFIGALLLFFYGSLSIIVGLDSNDPTLQLNMAIFSILYILILFIGMKLTRWKKYIYSLTLCLMIAIGLCSIVYFSIRSGGRDECALYTAQMVQPNQIGAYDDAEFIQRSNAYYTTCLKERHLKPLRTRPNGLLE